MREVVGQRAWVGGWVGALRRGWGFRGGRELRAQDARPGSVSQGVWDAPASALPRPGLKLSCHSFAEDGALRRWLTLVLHLLVRRRAGRATSRRLRPCGPSCRRCSSSPRPAPRARTWRRRSLTPSSALGSCGPCMPLPLQGLRACMRTTLALLESRAIRSCPGCHLTLCPHLARHDQAGHITCTRFVPNCCTNSPPTRPATNRLLTWCRVCVWGGVGEVGEVQRRLPFHGLALLDSACPPGAGSGWPRSRASSRWRCRSARRPWPIRPRWTGTSSSSRARR